MFVVMYRGSVRYVESSKDCTEKSFPYSSVVQEAVYKPFKMVAVDIAD